MAAEPTLMFCVGATKAGTSWLNEYLAAHPECHLKTVRELHYFDAIDLNRRHLQIRDLEAQAARFEARLAEVPPERRPLLETRVRERRDLAALIGRDEDPAAYLAYLAEGRGAARLMADMTPAYSLLSADRLRMMAGLMPDTRFLYILRDPVARLWSHVRMMAERRGAPDTGRAGGILKNTIAGVETEVATRSDYRGALERLWAAVDPARLKVTFFEDMLTRAGIARICAFLGIRTVEPELDRRVHAGPELDMPRDLAAAAREWLAPQYDFVAERIGHLPDAWLAARAGV